MKAARDLGGSAITLHSMQAKPGPDRCQAAKVFTAGEFVAAIDTFCFRSREQNRHIIAAVCMASREYLSGGCLTQDPFQGNISAAPKIGLRCLPNRGACL